MQEKGRSRSMDLTFDLPDPLKTAREAKDSTGSRREGHKVTGARHFSGKRTLGGGDLGPQATSRATLALIDSLARRDRRQEGEVGGPKELEGVTGMSEGGQITEGKGSPPLAPRERRSALPLCVASPSRPRQKLWSGGNDSESEINPSGESLSSGSPPHRPRTEHLFSTSTGTTSVSSISPISEIDSEFLDSSAEEEGLVSTISREGRKFRGWMGENAENFPQPFQAITVEECLLDAATSAMRYQAHPSAAHVIEPPAASRLPSSTVTIPSSTITLPNGDELKRTPSKPQEEAIMKIKVEEAEEREDSGKTATERPPPLPASPVPGSRPKGTSLDVGLWSSIALGGIVVMIGTLSIGYSMRYGAGPEEVAFEGVIPSEVPAVIVFSSPSSFDVPEVEDNHGGLGTHLLDPSPFSSFILLALVGLGAVGLCARHASFRRTTAQGQKVRHALQSGPTQFASVPHLPAKARSHIASRLPPEILRRILLHLCLDPNPLAADQLRICHRVTGLPSLCLVSRSWCEVTCPMIHQYLYLDTTSKLRRAAEMLVRNPDRAHQALSLSTHNLFFKSGDTGEEHSAASGYLLSILLVCRHLQAVSTFNLHQELGGLMMPALRRLHRLQFLRIYEREPHGKSFFSNVEDIRDFISSGRSHLRSFSWFNEIEGMGVDLEVDKGGEAKADVILKLFLDHPQDFYYRVLMFDHVTLRRLNLVQGGDFGFSNVTLLRILSKHGPELEGLVACFMPEGAYPLDHLIDLCPKLSYLDVGLNAASHRILPNLPPTLRTLRLSKCESLLFQVKLGKAIETSPNLSKLACIRILDHGTWTDKAVKTLRELCEGRGVKFKFESISGRGSLSLRNTRTHFQCHLREHDRNVAAIIPLYGCLGFLSVFREGSVKFGGLTTEGEMYVLATVFGAIYGAFQSYARTCFSELIPPRHEAQFFGLYSITDKSSSFLGPLIVGIIADSTGNIRYGFFFLIFMLLMPIPILVFAIDMKRGRVDAQRYAREESGNQT